MCVDVLFQFGASWCSQVSIRCAHVDPPPLRYFYHERRLLSSTLASSVCVCALSGIVLYSKHRILKNKCLCTHEMLPGFYVTHSFPRIVQMQETKGRGVRARGSPRSKRRVYVPLRSPSLSFLSPCTSMYLETPPPAFNNL